MPAQDPAEDLSLIFRALEFAAARHRDQTRKDAEKTPYINHPIDLAKLLVDEAGVTDPIVIAAAILHDTVEDTETRIEEIAQHFGPDIAQIVAEVTDDKSLLKEERKRLQVERAAHCSPGARLVKLADKICNLRDMAERPPANWSEARKLEYFDWALSVIDQLRGTHAALETLFDEAHRRGPS